MEDCDQQLDNLSVVVAASEAHLHKLTNQLERLQTKEDRENAGEIPASTWQMTM